MILQETNLRRAFKKDRLTPIFRGLRQSSGQRTVTQELSIIRFLKMLLCGTSKARAVIPLTRTIWKTSRGNWLTGSRQPIGPRIRPLTPALVMSCDSCHDYSSIGGPTTLKSSPYGSGGNSAKGTGSGSKSDSDFLYDAPREGLGVYGLMR